MMLGVDPPSGTFKSSKASENSAFNSFVNDLYLGRSTAVSLGQNIVLCPSKDSSTCENQSGWHVGWIIFIDENKNRQHDASETILKHHNELKRANLTSGKRTRIVFRPTGDSPGSNATFTFCEIDTMSTPPKAAILSNAGKIRISDTRPDGSELNCDYI